MLKVDKKIRVRILKDGEKPSKKNQRTNAFNPSVARQLAEAESQINKADNGIRLTPPNRPEKRKLPVSSRYQRLGEQLDLCPHELSVILEYNFQEPNDLVLAMVKKLVSAIKLTGEVDLQPIRRKLKEIEVAHQTEMSSYQEQMDYVARENRRRDDDKAKALRNLKTVWSGILIDLISRVDRNPDIESLGEWDQWTIRALEDITEGKACSIDSSGRVVIDFKSCRDLHYQDITCLPHSAENLKRNHEEELWWIWLGNASLEEIQMAYWKEGHEGDPRNRQTLLSREIKRRMGLTHDNFPKDTMGGESAGWESEDYPPF